MDKKRISSNRRQTKREMTIGITCSIIATIICSIISHLIHAVPKAGKSLSDTILNWIYKNAATASIDYIIIMTLSALIIMLLAFAIISFALPFMFSKSLSSLDQEIEKELSCELKNNKSVEKKPNKKKISAFKVLFIFSLIFFIIFAFDMIFGFIIPLGIRNDFREDLTIITPYITQEEKAHLESQWGLMDSKEDYLQIFEFVSDVKEKNGLNH